MKLWVDDERPAPDDSWTVAKTSNEAIKTLTYGSAYFTNWEEISLDHDLGGEDTGMKVVDWMTDYGFWPKVVTVHTANPPARKRMLAALNHEAPETVDIFVIYR